ncbi:MAG TPA: dihydropyrimidinase [Lentisphaeria bacterium]|nr:MAG: dihydropyrimidinase [Lentisphaerae bacterium GWF2_38_69]HBM15373.1 dihydropyrimidinase [Lentisphaeria bacterium]
MSLLIKSGLIITTAGNYKGDIYVENEKISAIGVNLSPQFLSSAEEVIDAEGKYILPGVIDPHTHISMPFMGTCAQDNYESGTIAAACGGVTTLIDFALQQKGETIKQSHDRKHSIAIGKVAIDYSLHSGITDLNPHVLNEVEDAILNYGTPSIKLFMTYSFRVNDEVILQMLTKAKHTGGLIQVHAENYYIIEYMNKMLEAQGKLSPIYHAKSRPNLAELDAVSRLIKFVELTDSNVYVVHLSTREGLEEIGAARKRGLEIYAETCPQYLILTEEKYEEPDWGGAKYVMSPPLRTKESNDSLWRGIKRRNIQTIGSDHCPFDFKGRKDMFGKDDYKKIPNGVPGIETILPLIYSEGVRKGKITINEMVSVLSSNTARIFGLTDKGDIDPGKDADIVIFDPEQKFTISANKLHMNVDYSPYEGIEVTGMPWMVFNRGKKVAKWNKDKVDFIGKAGDGKFIKRRPSKI